MLCSAKRFDRPYHNFFIAILIILITQRLKMNGGRYMSLVAQLGNVVCQMTQLCYTAG